MSGALREDVINAVVSNLSEAPPLLRCRQMLPEHKGGGRCTRYRMSGADGSKEMFCVAHSQTRHAQNIRDQRRRAQANQRRREAAARERLARELLPVGISSAHEFRQARLRVGRALIENRILPQQASVLVSMLAELERTSR